MGSIIITEKIHESMLKTFIEIKLEICSIYKAQYAEENNPLKFTELFQETRDTSTTQGLEVTLQNNPVECLLRSYRCAAYWKYVRLGTANDANCATSTFENTSAKYSCRIVASWNFTELCRIFSLYIWAHHTVKAVFTFIKLSFISASPELVR